MRQHSCQTSLCRYKRSSWGQLNLERHMRRTDAAQSRRHAPRDRLAEGRLWSIIVPTLVAVGGGVLTLWQAQPPSLAKDRWAPCHNTRKPRTEALDCFATRGAWSSNLEPPSTAP